MLVFLLVVTTGGGVVSANVGEEQAEETYSDGLCEHHPEHTEDCGYQEASEGSDCTHEHTEDCYTQDENGETILDCQHEHDDTCGYEEATEGSPCTYDCEICSGEENTTELVEETDETPILEVENTPEMTQVVSWIWIDDDEMLQKIDDYWGLGLPGANESNPVTQDILKEFLPSQIKANIALSPESTEGEKDTKTEEKILDIIWDLSSIPEEGIWTGDHVFTANLPEGYQMSENTDEMSVRLQLGGAETYFSLPSGSSTDAPFQNHIVDTVSPKGTTINLFDYWHTSQTAESEPGWGSGTLTNTRYPYNTISGNVPTVQNYGINAGHALIFSSGLENHFGSWNTWTGRGGNANNGNQPRQGIVKNTLVNGYPALNSVNTEDARYTYTSNNGTSYYYATLSGRDGDESLAYLFDPAIEVNGKASYEDVQNLLQVDDDGYYYYDAIENYAAYYEDDNSFAVYDTAGVQPAGQGNSGQGQFFPFNSAGDVFTERGGSLIKNGITTESTTLNHFFGVTMSTRFVQQYSGYTDEHHTDRVTYDFSGDDDVWVFIDDVLVADLGGVHNRSSLSIDFVTGEVVVGKNYNGSGSNTETTTLKEKYNEAGKSGTTSWNGNTFADNTFHTLDFYYLERGAVDSNMSLKFNLVTIPESSLIKVDQAGDPVPDAEFTLYAPDGVTKIAEGTTDRDGEFVFVDEEGFILSIQQIYEKSVSYTHLTLPTNSRV